jgi:uncharacterized protein YfaS (alpha-2-macroglobulin family)
VRGLLAHRVAGRWRTTQENVFVLLALSRWFRTAETQEPDFTVRAWLGGRFLGGHEFEGRTADRHHVQVPMAWLQELPPASEALLAKDGPGRLYWRMALEHAPADLRLEPASHGFDVERSYSGADDEGDVERAEDGTWRVKAGARVKVSLVMVAPARRHHVALADPLPAGLEPENPALATTPELPGEAGAPPGGGLRPLTWLGPWWQHQNLRDDRAEAFTMLLPGGAWRYEYFARATTPGRYVTPPAKAEEMYHPETFGRGATDVVVVE